MVAGEIPAGSTSFGRVVQRELEDPTDRESVSLGGASPLSPTISLPGRLIAGHRPLKASVVVRVHPRQPISAAR